MSSTGERLRIAREQAGLSQGQVAKLLAKHRPTISQIEAGKRRVLADELSDFARIYEVSISWLAGEELGVEDVSDRVRLAARELAKFKGEDLDRILDLLAKMRGNLE